MSHSVTLLPPVTHTPRQSAAVVLAATALARVPVDTAEGSIPIQFSIGQAVYPTDGSTHQELLATADEAMYATKLSASARR